MAAFRSTADARHNSKLQSLLEGHNGSHRREIDDAPLTDHQAHCRVRRSSSAHLGLQLVLICIYKATQPLFFLVVTPFINFMLVYQLHMADEVHVGYYSGLVESITSLGMVTGTAILSHLSDIYGRKRLLLVGVILSCLLPGAFGFIRAYWLLLCVRLCMGLAISAQAATARVMVSELSTSDNIAKNLVYTGVGWQLGATFAPALGGILATPAKSWPSLFENTLWDAYPYALPSAATAVLPLCAALTGFCVLQETGCALNSSSVSDFKIVQEQDTRTAQSLTTRFRALAKEKIYPTNGLPDLFSCGGDFVLACAGLQTLQIISLQIAELLFFFSSPSNGGLGLTPRQMSVYLTMRPLLICLFEVTTFDKLSKRMGIESYLRKLVCLPPFLFVLYFFMAHATMAGTLSPTLRVSGLGISLLLQVVSNSAYVCYDVLIPARSPTAEQLSTINALAEIVGQLAVGLGALSGSSLFALSAGAHGKFWRGQMVWVILFFLSCFVTRFTRKITHIAGWREQAEGFGSRDV